LRVFCVLVTVSRFIDHCGRAEIIMHRYKMNSDTAQLLVSILDTFTHIVIKTTVL